MFQLHDFGQQPGAGDGISLSSCDDGECRAHSSDDWIEIDWMFVFPRIKLIKREFHSLCGLCGCLNA